MALLEAACAGKDDMAYKAYIFDLDGTLLDTLPDLVRLANMVLDRRGWPQRTRDEVLSYVGGGGRVLLRRAAPAEADEAEVDAMFEVWRELYPVYGHELTKPYAGVEEALSQLKERDVKLGVLSNKFDAAVKDVIALHFPGVFDVARGECEEIPRKPDPRGLLSVIEQMGVEPSQVAYIGDSGSDMTVAIAAGADPIGVSWGYRPVEELLEAGAVRVVDNPSELAVL